NIYQQPGALFVGVAIAGPAGGGGGVHVDQVLAHKRLLLVVERRPNPFAGLLFRHDRPSCALPRIMAPDLFEGAGAGRYIGGRASVAVRRRPGYSRLPQVLPCTTPQQEPPRAPWTPSSRWARATSSCARPRGRSRPSAACATAPGRSSPPA